MPSSTQPRLLFFFAFLLLCKHSQMAAKTARMTIPVTRENTTVAFFSPHVSRSMPVGCIQISSGVSSSARVEVWANFEAPKTTSRGPTPTLLTSGPMYGPTPASSTSGPGGCGWGSWTERYRVHFDGHEVGAGDGWWRDVLQLVVGDGFRHVFGAEFGSWGLVS